MKEKITIYKYLAPIVQDDKLVCTLVPMLFSEPRESLINEREMLNIMDLGKKVTKVKKKRKPSFWDRFKNETDVEKKKVEVNFKILVPYDLGKEVSQPVEVKSNLQDWLKAYVQDDKEFLEGLRGQLESMWGPLIDNMMANQFYKIGWDVLKYLMLFTPTFPIYSIASGYDLSRRWMKKENLKHMDEDMIAGVKAIVEQDPQVEVNVHVESSESLKKIRELMEHGLEMGDSPKKIKKDINDYLVKSVGYGEYTSEVHVPDIIYEFYRNEAVAETFGRERNPTLLWEIKDGVTANKDRIEKAADKKGIKSCGDDADAVLQHFSHDFSEWAWMNSGIFHGYTVPIPEGEEYVIPVPAEYVDLKELFPVNVNSLRKVRTSKDVGKIIDKICEMSPRCKDEIVCYDDFDQPIRILEITSNPDAKDVIRVLFSLHGCEFNPYMSVVSPLAGLDVIYHYATTDDPVDKKILEKYKLKFCFVSPSGFDLRARQMERVNGESFYWIHGRRPLPYGDVLPVDVNSWIDKIRNPKNIRAVAEDTEKEVERFGMDLHETQTLRDAQIELMIDHPLLRGLVTIETYGSKEDEKIGDGVAKELKGKNLLQSWNEIYLKLLYAVGTESTLYQRYLLRKELKPKGDGRAEEGELIRKGTNVYNVFVNKKYNIPAITFEACGRPYVTDSEAFSSLRNATIAGIRSFYSVKEG